VGLAALLKYLLGASGTLTRFTGVREAADRDGFGDADTVVLDLPREGADTTLAQVRHRYRGELIVLADRGRHRHHGVAPDPALTLLERPFSAVDLGTALGLPGLDAATAPGPKAEPKPDRHPPVEIRTARPLPAALAGPAAASADVKAAARRSPSWAPLAATAGNAKAGLVERISRVAATLTQGWQAKRRVRVAGFSVFALIAFTVAFALASQGQCGPGCDALGTVFSPDPTVAPAESRAPSTTGPKRATTTTAVRSGPGGTGSFQGVVGGRLATTTTERRATTTTRRPSPTTRPPTTRPPTTPTTAPPTTSPTTAPPTTAPPTTGGA
jgi:hypothetical protein